VPAEASFKYLSVYASDVRGRYKVADPPMRQWPTVDDSKEHTAIDKTRVKKLLAALVQDLKNYEDGATGGRARLRTSPTP